jgi:hypothetical protein
MKAAKRIDEESHPRKILSASICRWWFPFKKVVSSPTIYRGVIEGIR